MVSENKLGVKYYCSGNQIELHDFIETQSNLLGLIQEVKKELSCEQEVSVKIEAIKPGSFDVSLVVGSVSALLPVAPQILEILQNYLKLKLLLRGEEADRIDVDGDGNHVTYCKGNENVTVNTTTNNFYIGSQEADKVATRIFSALEKTKNIDAIEITTPTDAPLYVNKNDYSNMTKSNPYLGKQLQERTQVVRAVVYIKKVEYYPGNTVKWDFIYNENKITAKIADVVFIAKINSGLKIGKGDALDIDMVIKNKWNIQEDIIVSTSYDIEKVHDIINGPENYSFGTDFE